MKPSLAVLVAVAGLCAVLAPAPIAGQSRSKNPHGALRTECAECHSMEGWSPLKTPLPFKHATTGFDLAGAHSAATCKACHATLDFSVEKGKSDCFACHQAAFTRATRPSHTGFPTACKNCHGVAAWQPASFDHNQTRFQLHGAHRTVDCISCHRNGYTATPSECFTCHQKDFTGARNPSEHRRGTIRAGVAQIYAVEQIEELSPKLQAMSFKRQVESLEGGEIHPSGTGTCQGISPD